MRIHRAAKLFRSNFTKDRERATIQLTDVTNSCDWQSKSRAKSHWRCASRVYILTRTWRTRSARRATPRHARPFTRHGLGSKHRRNYARRSKGHLRNAYWPMTDATDVVEISWDVTCWRNCASRFRSVWAFCVLQQRKYTSRVSHVGSTILFKIKFNKITCSQIETN